jgi:hypothetical protein
MKNSCNILLRKPSGMRPFGRAECRWEDNIKLDLKKYDVKLWLLFTWFRIRPNHGLL